MKTIQKMHFVTSSLVLLAMVMLSKATWAQPVVTVPASCNVVVAGTGGTTGFGGIVGSGGIVVMPDLTTAAGIFTINPMGNTILGWGLAGDLSVAPISQPSPAVQSAGAVLSLNITSYNLNVRVPSETTPPSSATLARSKGRVSISYTNPTATCGGGISFDIFKLYPNTGSGIGFVPPIIGPDCLEPLTTYTYSVDQIASDNYSAGIGGDEYYWTIPGTLGSFYNSADKSSITFTTPTTLTGTYTLRCCYGRANPWDGNITPPTAANGTCVTKVIGLQPSAPTFSSAPPTCLSTATTTFNVVISPAPFAYTLTSSNTNWTVTPGGTGSFAINTNGNNDPSTLTLVATNGSCAPSTFTYVVNRQFAAPMTINGTACVAAGSVTNYILSTGLQNTTCWTLPTGWSLVSANGPASSSVNVTVPAGTTAGAYVISAKSCACPAGVLNFTVNVRPGTPVITGPTCVTRNGGPTSVYTASGSAGATSYTWTIPSGWGCTLNCLTNTPTFQPGGTAITAQNILVTAVGTNGCNATSAPFVVNYSPIAPNTITTSCWNFGVAGNTTITVANRPLPFYGSYTVTSVPSGLIVPGSVMTNSTTGVITLTTLATAPAGSYTLLITHTTTACGNSTTTSFPITYNGNGTVLTTVYNPGAGGPDVYIASGAPGGSTFQWSVNGSPVAGATSSVLSLTGSGTPPTSVCVDVTSGTCVTRLCANPPGTHNLAPIDPRNNVERMLSAVQVFPNPTNGSFTMKIPAFEKEASLQIIDAAGREIGTHRLKEGENHISEKEMVTGEYFLILNLDGNYSSHKLQVSQK